MSIRLHLSTDIPPTLSEMEQFCRIARVLGINDGVVHLADITKEDGTLDCGVSWGPVVEAMESASEADPFDLSQRGHP